MDIDIDFANREHILSKLKYHTAILTDGKKHNTGVYVTQIPNDPRTNLATIEYKQAERRGSVSYTHLTLPTICSV